MVWLVIERALVEVRRRELRELLLAHRREAGGELGVVHLHRLRQDPDQDGVVHRGAGLPLRPPPDLERPGEGAELGGARLGHQHLHAARDLPADWPCVSIPWTRSGWPAIEEPWGTLPGTDPREYLYLVAENDSQTPTLSGDRAGRLAGIPVMAQSSRHPWGMAVVESPHEGSAYLGLDFGDRPVPRGNLSPTEDDGGHRGVGFTEVGRAMVLSFLATGHVVVPCEGVCDVRPE